MPQPTLILLISQNSREIADAVGAKLMVDMAHIAGLVAAGLPIQVQFLMHISRQRPLTRPFVALVEA